jgi:aromatic-L-amino-acid decarboxylase
MKEVQVKEIRVAPIEMSVEEFRQLGYRLVDRIGDLLATIRDRPVTPGEAPEQVRAALDASASLPEQGGDAAEIMDRAADLLIEHSLYNGHPKFMGYITSSPAPLGMLGDLLASAVNANAGGWILSPMASEIEAQTVRWIADLIGYPGQAGLLVSGGNMANIVGCLAARTAKAGWDVRGQGLNHPSARKLRIYASAETHTWIQKAADILGLGTESTRWVETDSRQRISLKALRQALDRDIAAGDQPFMVVGTAGSVSTGVTDPLPELAELCKEYDLWFHVDGAYGGFAAAAPSAPDDLLGLSQADSIAIDPHKWLYSPLEAGCVLVRDPETLRQTFSYHPPYYYFGQEAVNFVDFGPQNSRGFRALKVWLTLQQVGREGYARMIEDDINLAREMHRVVDEHPELEAVTHNLSITTFRYVPEDLKERVGTLEAEAYLNELNEKILDRQEKGGEVFVSKAEIDGRFLLRACIVNFRTSMEDIQALPEIIARYGREAHAELKQAS